MPKYVIEREMPGIGSRPQEELKAAAKKSQGIIDKMEGIQWVQSYVVDDKIYCVYIAKDEETIRDHAKRGGFPCNSISEIATVIDPTTGET